VSNDKTNPHSASPALSQHDEGEHSDGERELEASGEHGGIEMKRERG
jgi:hypothetical protein